jgi:hypothetical protein
VWWRLLLLLLADAVLVMDQQTERQTHGLLLLQVGCQLLPEACH